MDIYLLKGKRELRNPNGLKNSVPHISGICDEWVTILGYGPKTLFPEPISCNNKRRF